MRSVKQRVHAVIKERIDDQATLTNDKRLVEDLDADDLAVIETIMGLEEEFEVDILDEDAETLKTVGDIITYLEALFPEPVPFGPAPTSWQRIMGED